MFQNCSSAEIDQNRGISEERGFRLILDHGLVSLGVSFDGATSSSYGPHNGSSKPCIEISGHLEATRQLDFGDCALCLRGSNCEQGGQSEIDTSHSQIFIL